MTLTIKPLDAPIGAEVTGVNLAHPLDAGVADEIRTALCEHAVFVFPDQELSPEAQVWLTRQLGEPEVHVLSDFTLPGRPEVFIVSNVRAGARPVGAVTDALLSETDTSTVSAASVAPVRESVNAAAAPSVALVVSVCRA